jgi:hypothetical protein
MAKAQWTITHNTTDITSRVLSFQLDQGRNQYIDQYPGGRVRITINNSANYAVGIEYGSQIKVETNPAGVQFFTIYWVESVTYSDYPGNTGLNTATIICADWIARAGRVYANALVLSAMDTTLQMKQFEASNLGPLPADMLILGGSGSSTAAATTYTGTAANYLNLLQTTERGYLVLRGTYLYMVGRGQVNTFTPSFTLGRSPSNTVMAYQEFLRIEAGAQYINTATIEPEPLADQTAVNTTSRTTYGPAFYSSATVDNTTTQALGNAQWIVNTFGDPNVLRFDVTITDTMQTTTGWNSFMQTVWGSDNRVVNIDYTVPGGSSVTVPAVIEGANFRVTPNQTVLNMSLSPLTFYQFFTLNSSTLGILNTSRLGW